MKKWNLLHKIGIKPIFDIVIVIEFVNLQQLYKKHTNKNIK